MSPQTTDLPRTPESYWLGSTPQTNYPALAEDIEADVAIVGGGLAGISTAWMMKQEGLRVAVPEADRICQGTTGHSTAKITSQHNLIYDEIQSQLGRELARQYAEANETAVRTMADIIQRHNIDCDFQWKPAYVYTQQHKYIEKIEKEAKTAAGLGIKAEYLDTLDLPFAVKAAVRFDGQAQFHPRKYVLALAEKIPGDGSHIFEQTPAVGLQEGSPNVVVTKKGKTVRAEKVVVASHFPFHDGLGLYFARMYPERSYVLGVLTRDQIPSGMYVTAETPGQSLRTQPCKDGEMLLVAGEQHKTAQEDTMTHYKVLRDFAVNTFDVSSIPYRWSTQDYTTIDKIPYIGYIRPGNKNIFVATGFRKWGISTSTVAALLITDLATKGESPWQEVYSPQRKLNLQSAKQLAQINIDVVKSLVSGKLNNPSVQEIKKGEGQIVEIDGQKIGAYRDAQGQLHAVDITCTHLGCELNWNSGEKTWDCPCHGSRFSYEGAIVEGPAVHPLRHLAEGKNDIDPDII